MDPPQQNGNTDAPTPTAEPTQSQSETPPSDAPQPQLESPKEKTPANVTTTTSIKDIPCPEGLTNALDR